MHYHIYLDESLKVCPNLFHPFGSCVTHDSICTRSSPDPSLYAEGLNAFLALFNGWIDQKSPALTQQPPSTATLATYWVTSLIITFFNPLYTFRWYGGGPFVVPLIATGIRSYLELKSWSAKSLDRGLSSYLNSNLDLYCLDMVMPVYWSFRLIV